MERTRHFQGLLILLVVVGLGALYLRQNRQPAVTVSVPMATETPAGQAAQEWQQALAAQIAAAATPLPSPPAATATPYVPPTLLPTAQAEGPVVKPQEIAYTPWPTPTPRPTQILPTQAGPTPYPSPTGLFLPDEQPVAQFQPPPEQVPLSAHANDHFWLVRPVDSSANSAELFYYTFGSNGSQGQWRVHHGVDMPNPIGEPIHAGGSGYVLFAGNGADFADTRGLDVYPSYGNAVVVEQDFGYRGQKIYTLYAHMQAISVQQGQRVQAGDVLGLVGGTGDVSGPHVHTEVRVGENKYFAVQNPVLWIAPFLGHGVVAGRVTGPDGAWIEDATVTLSQRGRVVQTITTYIGARQPGQVRDWHVVPDAAWRENFVIGDVPQGEYEISVVVNGQRFQKTLSVTAGATNFVTLGWDGLATPQPVGEG